MYLKHFGLTQSPYRITPDTALFYAGAERGAILDALAYAIKSGEAISKVIGEVGSGKTMLCRMLENKLPANIEIVYLANPSLAPENVLHAIALELGLAIDVNDNRLHVMRALQDHLLQRHAQNKQVVVFVEEAQAMPLASLEEIRLLSNLETQQHKLLQIVLFGQPELDVGLKAPHVRQIKERITNSFYLPPLPREEINSYLAFRLHSVGYHGAPVFSPAAVRLIVHHSKGLMRRINIIADKALLSAYALSSRAVTRQHVRAALNDCEFINLIPRWSRGLAVIGTLSLTLTLAITGSAQPPTEQNPWQKATPDIGVIAPATDLLTRQLQTSAAWLNQASPEHFTIQVLWAKPDEQPGVKDFLHQAKRAGLLTELFVYRANNASLSVVFGEYAAYADALAALETLPDHLKRYQPFLRNVRGVLAEAATMKESA